MKNIVKAKPFIKWVGGKGQLLEQLDALLPTGFNEWENVTYIEPFGGGGAMLFHMLQKYPNITRAVINDINHDLIITYRVVRDNPEKLIDALRSMETSYYALPDMEFKKAMFLNMRSIYNNMRNRPVLSEVELAAHFIFLNKTCFNGLYRVNRDGKFNVPFGKYKSPRICDEALIKADSEILKCVEILEGNFADTVNYADGKTLFYFDPPYRPISKTSNFNDYTKDGFNDAMQISLKELCDTINNSGYAFLLSNSDCPDGFFDKLYSDYHINRVSASRSVNSNAAKRGKITEIVVSNF